MKLRSNLYSQCERVYHTDVVLSATPQFTSNSQHFHYGASHAAYCTSVWIFCVPGSFCKTCAGNVDTEPLLKISV